MTFILSYNNKYDNSIKILYINIYVIMFYQKKLKRT